LMSIKIAVRSEPLPREQEDDPDALLFFHDLR
jgi:hypothetical protein